MKERAKVKDGQRGTRHGRIRDVRGREGQEGLGNEIATSKVTACLGV